MTENPIKIPASSSEVTIPSGFEYGEDYAFYDARTSIIPDYYQKILSTATKSIQIWDTHFRPEYDGLVFSKVTCPNLKIQIMTICDKDYNTQQDVNNLANGIMENLPDEVKVCTLTVYALSDWSRFHRKLWHDRFLVIDDDKYFLVGASMNNQSGSTTSFGIHYLSKKADWEVLKKKLDSYTSVTGDTRNVIKVTRRRT